jgi:LCP family protein required for cell wall assembly
MRTTLKRGMGRGAAVNGNGHAVLPPDVLTPLTHYRQPAHRHPFLRLLGKFVLWLSASVVMLAVALAGGSYLFFHQSVAAVSAHSADVKAAAERLDVPLPNHAAIALVVGYDHRADERGLPSRSDTVMLIRADPQGKVISLLSFPRDLIVDIRCPARGFLYRDRINTAYAECQSQGTLETVRSLTGIPINYLMTVNFRGFKQVVDRIGGVWIDVDRRYYNHNVGTFETNYADIDLRPGYQRLGGSDALDFVRYRHTDNDLVRNARQQIFVRAVREQVASSISVTRLPKVIGAITHNVEIGQGGSNEISDKTVLSYALFAYQLPSGHFVQTKINGLYGDATLETDPSNVTAAVQEFMNPDVDAPEKATASALGRKARLKTGPPPRQVSMTVLNGNGVEGAAANTTYQLSKIGYQMRLPPTNLEANAPRRSFHTKIYWDPRQPRSQAAARKVANLFGDADVQRGVPGELQVLGNNAMLVVVLGTTFHGSLAAAPRDETPKRQPPYVRRDPSSALPYLRSVRKRVDFRLQLPTVLERSSSIDSESPARVYKINDDHRAVRLTFRTSASEYWGIEQTDWDDAPILADPNTTHREKGRRYDFYYSGSHLHMVVVRADGATYWVVNTLLDKLSNETMLAIARGLRPLRAK